jgi:hypothetical protein
MGVTRLMVIVAGNNTQDAFTSIFISFQSFGLFGSILALLTARFSSVKRQATWYNFFISWGIFCLSFLLLPLSGNLHGPEPGFALCIAQSSLTYATPPLYVSPLFL